MVLGRRFPITEVGEESWFKSLGSGEFPTTSFWSVVNDNENLVGLSRITDIDWIHRTCWFGVWLDPEQWGNGYGFDATKMTVGHAFAQFNLRQVRLHVLRNNSRALSLYSNLGFEEEATLKNAAIIDNEELDLVQMVLDHASFTRSTR